MEEIVLRVVIEETTNGIRLRYERMDNQKLSENFKKVVADKFGFDIRTFTMSNKEFIQVARSEISV